MSATATSDFSIKSPYILPGASRGLPVTVLIEKMARDAVDRVVASLQERQAAAQSATAQAAAEAVQAAPQRPAFGRAAQAAAGDFLAGVTTRGGEFVANDLTRGSDILRAGGTALSDMLAKLLEVFRKLFTKMFAAITGRQGVEEGAEDAASETASDNKAEELSVRSEAAATRGVAAVLKLVDDLVKDGGLAEAISLLAEDKDSPKLLEKFSSKLSEVEEKLTLLEKEIDAQEEVCHAAMNDYAANGMSAGKIKRLLEQGGDALALVPARVLDEINTRQTLMDARTQMGAFANVFVSGVKGLAGAQAAALDEIVAKAPLTQKALAETDQAAAKAAAEQFSPTPGPAVQPQGIGPISPAAAANERLAAMAAGRPVFGSGRGGLPGDGPPGADACDFDADDAVGAAPRPRQ